MDLNIHININGSGEVSAEVTGAQRASRISSSSLPQPSMESLQQAAGDGGTPSGLPVPTLAPGESQAGSLDNSNGSLPAPGDPGSAREAVSQGMAATGGLPAPLIMGTEMRAAGDDRLREPLPEPLPDDQLQARIAVAERTSAEAPKSKSSGRKSKEG